MKKLQYLLQKRVAICGYHGTMKIRWTREQTFDFENTLLWECDRYVFERYGKRNCNPV